MPKPFHFPPKFFDPHFDARVKLQAEIKQLEKRLIELKVAHNALIPVSSLHTEILQDIFFLAHSQTLYWHGGKASLRLSWVCHDWREIALNTSDIWTRIDYAHLEWAEAALSRTKNSQLEFDFSHAAWQPHGKDIKRDPFPIISLYLSYLPRIRKLHISAKNRDDRTSFPDSAPEWMIQAPHLVDLSLQGFTLPPNLFSGSCPSLCSVYLSYCLFDWDMLYIPQEIEDFTIVHPHTLVSIGKIVDILEIIGSTIETLSLIGVFDPEDLSISSPERDRIPLPNLKSLHLDDEVPVMFEHLLNYITLPPGLNVKIRLSESADSDSYSDMINALIASREVEKWPIDCLEVQTNSDDFTICIKENWTNSDIEAAQPEGHDTRTLIQLEFWGIEDSSRLWHIFDLLPIHPVEEVFLTGEVDLQNTDTPDYFGRLGTVRKLSVDLSALGSFCTRIEELGEDIQGSEVDSEEKKRMAQDTFFFPGLQELRIHGDNSYGDAFSNEHENVDYIQKWLRRRDWLGVPLERLVLSNMLAPPIPWIEKTFGGIVLSLQMTRLEEDEDWEGSEVEESDTEELETEEPDVEDSVIEG